MAKSGPQIDQSACRIRPCHIINAINIGPSSHGNGLFEGNFLQLWEPWLSFR